MNKETQEEIKKLRSWLSPKEVQIQSIKYSIQGQELLIKTIKDKKESGFFLKHADKEISEQITRLTIEEKNIEKERITRDLAYGYYTKLADIELRKLQEKLKMEENIINGVHDKITKLSRNHKVEKSQDKETEEVKATADMIEKEEMTPSEAKEWD